MFLLLFVSMSGKAQYDSLLHLSYGKDIYKIHHLYRTLIDIPDSTLRAKKANEIIAFARENKDRNLELNVAFFLNFWNAFFEKQPQSVSLKKLREQLDQSTKHNVEFLRARSLRALAEFYWKIQRNYQLAFEQYLLLDMEISKVNPNDYPEMARDLMQIGQSYYFFRDYTLAIHYFKRAIALPETPFTTAVINDARNTLGLCYQRLKKYDSAAFYFQEILKTHFPESFAWKRIAKGNIGGTYYLEGKFEKALPLLIADYNIASKENDWGAATGSAISLADIYRIQKNNTACEFYIQKALEGIQKSNQTNSFRLLYPIMSKWNADRGNATLAKAYLDSAIVSFNRYNNEFSALKILKAQQEINRQTEALQIANFNLERSRKISQRNFLIFIILIIGSWAILYYFIQRKRQIAKDFILQQTTQNLKIAHIKLTKFTENILEKNKLIEDLENKLEGKMGQIEPQLLNQLQQSTILTEADWTKFKQLFEQVHAGFLFRLKEKYPNLSPAEIRYLSLAKLQFSNKEMAATLGVSSQSIRTNWYRIRKKNELPDTMNVEDLVSSI